MAFLSNDMVRISRRGRRFSPLALIFAIAILGSPAFAAEEMLPRTVDRSCALVQTGRSLGVIVYPSLADGRELGLEAQRAIQDATGVLLPLMADSELVQQIPSWPAEEFQKRPLILIGNINCQRALIPLYGNLLAAEDLSYPVGDGFTLRTAVDPYGAGVNHIVLGGSSPAGIRKALAAFTEQVNQHGRSGELVLPGLLQVTPGGAYVDICRQASASGLNYQWTGDDRLLQSAVANLRAADFMRPNVRSYNPDHYSKEAKVRELIALIQSGALEQDEVHHIENALLAGLHEEYDQYWIVHDASWVGTRHQTMGMMAFLVTADYLLHRAKPNAEAAAFLKRYVGESHAFFRQFAEHYRDEGNDNTSFDSTGPICRYAMAFGDEKFFTNGSARLMSRRALMMVDNRGWFAAPGNYEDTRPGNMNSGVDTSYSLQIPAFVERDGQRKWILQNAAGFPSMNGGGWGFDSGIAGNRYPLGADLPAVEPTDWQGVMVQPLPEYYYKRCGNYMTHGGGYRVGHDWEPLIPPDRAVEAVAFRDKFARDAEYLFVSGVQGGRYNSLDANSIVRYSDRGNVWLMAQTEQFGHYVRNALHIGHGSRGDYLQMPGTVRLDESVSTPRVGMTATTLPRFNGADWRRQILWARGRYFVVIDTAVFSEVGDYDLTCSWRSLPIAALEDGVWTARQGGSRFELHNADGVEQTSGFERGHTTEQMAVVPSMLRQHRSCAGSAGQHVSFRNMFFTQSDEQPRAYRVKPIGNDAVIVSDGKDYFALAGANFGGLEELAGFKIDAKLFFVSTDAICLAPNDSRLLMDGKQIASVTTDSSVHDRLRTLWESAEASVPAPAPAQSDVGKAVWKFDGLERMHEEVGGVRVIHPPIPDVEHELFDRQIRAHSKPVSWPAGVKSVTYDLGREERIAEIHLDQQYGIYLDKDRNPHWRKPGSGPEILGFSNDGFKNDVRQVELPYDEVWRQDSPYIYKPYYYAPKNWKEFSREGAAPLDITARYIRTPARDTWETRFFRDQTRPAKVEHLERVDFDGDGVDELAIATEARELVVLDFAGHLKWRKRLDNQITDVLAIRLDDTAAETLLVADNGWYIRGYDGAGKEVFFSDCKQQGISGAFALADARRTNTSPPLIAVGTGNGSVCLDRTGKLLASVGTTGVSTDAVLAGNTSHPIAQKRLAFRSAWGDGGWSDMPAIATGAASNSAMPPAAGPLGGYWWLGLGFEFWPEEGAPAGAAWRDGMAVFIGRHGVNAYAMGDAAPSARWSLPASGPVSDYAFAEMDGQPGLELVLSRLDGFIEVVSRDGKVFNTLSIRGPARTLSRWNGGGANIAVATHDSVRLYSSDASECGRLRVIADRVVTLRGAPDHGNRLVCIRPQGDVIAFEESSLEK